MEKVLSTAMQLSGWFSNRDTRQARAVRGPEPKSKLLILARSGVTGNAMNAGEPQVAGEPAIKPGNPENATWYQ